LIQLYDEVLSYQSFIAFPDSRPELLARMVETEGEPLKLPEPPPELRLYWEVTESGYMPWAGGLYDQPIAFSMAFNTIRNALNEVERTKQVNARNEAQANGSQ